MTSGEQKYRAILLKAVEEWLEDEQDVERDFYVPSEAAELMTSAALLVYDAFRAQEHYLKDEAGWEEP